MQYYRTAAGDHRHQSFSCALMHKRSLMLGEADIIPAGEMDAYEPCSRCCTDAEVAAFVKPAPAVDGKCTNKVPAAGSYNSRRVSPRGTCPACGAVDVSMVRSSMSLRKHDRPC